MILVDTSIWIDHLQKSDALLARLLRERKVLCHPMVIGEIAVGSFKQRDVILRQLRTLPSAVQASHNEAVEFITLYSLYGSGIGYIDAHLLAATRLTRGSAIWTGDKRLKSAAERLLLDFQTHNAKS
jgi:predicted nucleic acid-binding protein